MKNWLPIQSGLLFSALLFPLLLIASQKTEGAMGEQSDQKQKSVKIWVRENGKMVEMDTTHVKGAGGILWTGKSRYTAADSIHKNRDKDSKTRVVTVTVVDDSAVTGQPTTFTYTIGDTLRKDVKHGMMMLDNGRKVNNLQNEGTFPSEFTTVSDVESAGLLLHRTSNSFDFDSKDPGIVSYKKKDLGKGLEKIVVIRKKAK